MERKYNFREMKSLDVMRLTSVISKIGLSNLEPMINEFINNSKVKDENLTKEQINAKNTELAVKLGLGIVELILSNLENCGEALIRYMASVSEDMSREDIEDLKGAEFFAMVMDLFTRKEYMDFFKVALKFRK